MKYDFEKLANFFSEEFNNGRTISRCDFLVIEIDYVAFIEETDLSTKDLLKPKEYSKQIQENVKKMWGSFAVLIWSVERKCIAAKCIENKKKIYVLDLSNSRDPTQYIRMARVLTNMFKTLGKFKNGAIDEVKVILPDNIKTIY